MSEIRIAGKSWDFPNRSNDFITIHVVGDHNCQLSVRRFDQILSLKEYGIKGTRFVMNGILLNPSLSFGFYEIAEQATIHVIGDRLLSKMEIKDQDKKWRVKDRLIKEENRLLLLQKYQMNSNDSLSDPLREPEVARLNDVFRGRLEANPSVFRKICTRFSAFADSYEQPNDENPTVLPNKAQNPSTEDLPLNEEKTPSHSLTQDNCYQ